jgi:predicted transposase/invertase (TIGR01784 family)
VFTEDQEIHLLELRKFAVPADKLTSPLEAWLYFLRHGATLDSEHLPPALDRPPIHQAMEVLTVMTQSELERERYEARRKLQHDHITLLLAAEQRGRAEGRAEGEALGRAQGDMARIHLCQRMLKRALTPREQLLAMTAEQRERLVEEMEKELAPE